MPSALKTWYPSVFLPLAAVRSKYQAPEISAVIRLAPMEKMNRQVIINFRIIADTP